MKKWISELKDRLPCFHKWVEVSRGYSGMFFSVTLRCRKCGQETTEMA